MRDESSIYVPRREGRGVQRRGAGAAEGRTNWLRRGDGLTARPPRLATELQLLYNLLLHNVTLRDGGVFFLKFKECMREGESINYLPTVSQLEMRRRVVKHNCK